MNFQPMTHFLTHFVTPDPLCALRHIEYRTFFPLTACNTLGNQLGDPILFGEWYVGE